MSRPIVTVSTPPAEAPVSLTEAKAHLRVEWTDEDTIIQAYLDAAIAVLDGPTGWLGRAMCAQSWQHVCGGTHFGKVWLTAQPNALSSIYYLDPTTEAETLAPIADFRIHSDGYQFAVVPKTGKTWPATANRSDALKLTFTTGYGGASSVPKPIKQAILLLVGHWFKEREAATVVAMRELPFGVQALLNTYKIGFVA